MDYDHDHYLMPQISLKENFRAAQPVSYSWYNTVARELKKLIAGSDQLKDLPGYDAGATQALMNVSGTIQWVTVAECD